MPRPFLQRSAAFLCAAVPQFPASAQAAGDATIVTGESQTYELRLTQQTYEAANRIGLVLSRRLSPADKTTQLRVVVGDNPTGAVGSVTIFLSGVLSTGGN